MEKFVYIPFVSVGGVNFSEKREDVRKKFGNFTEFKKSKFSKNTTDNFGFCHIFYNTDNLCEAIEFFGDYSFFYDDKDIGKITYGDLKEFLSKKDAELKIDNDGITSNAYGISVYAPNEEIESILVFREKYFD